MGEPSTPDVPLESFGFGADEARRIEELRAPRDRAELEAQAALSEAVEAHMRYSAAEIEAKAAMGRAEEAHKELVRALSAEGLPSRLPRARLVSWRQGEVHG